LNENGSKISVAATSSATDELFFLPPVVFFVLFGAAHPVALVVVVSIFKTIQNTILHFAGKGGSDFC
jgi:hypothetical protein